MKKQSGNGLSGIIQQKSVESGKNAGDVVKLNSHIHISLQEIMLVKIIFTVYAKSAETRQQKQKEINSIIKFVKSVDKIRKVVSLYFKRYKEVIKYGKNTN